MFGETSMGIWGYGIWDMGYGIWMVDKRMLNFFGSKLTSMAGSRVHVL